MDHRPPYLGVSGPVANSIRCDRVGLAVRLWIRDTHGRTLMTRVHVGLHAGWG